MGRRYLTWAIVAAAVLAAAVAAPSKSSGSDTEGKTTVEQTVVGGDPGQGYSQLGLGAGRPYVVREELTSARPGREARRRSIVYLAQLTDLQLSDEESPLRVEFPFETPFAPIGQAAAGEGEEEPEQHDHVREDESETGASSWRPQEALVAHQIELSIRQVNRFRRSPVPQGDGRRARMLNAVLTGDLADNQQRNETEWVVRLLEGGIVHPNSGTADLNDYDEVCRGLVAAGHLDPGDAPRYTGIQDYDDYFDSPHFYDPDKPLGIYRERGWPLYPGLMDAAQKPFRAEGLKVPSYVAFGNHDGLVQGNEDANAFYDYAATGCLKPLGNAVPNPLRFGDVFDPDYLRSLVGSDPAKVMAVPPDPNRQLVDKAQFKQIHTTPAQPDAHGFAHVDAHELEASRGAASYYSFSPRQGLRYIVLDTVGQGGSFIYSPDPGSGGSTRTVGASTGNLDHPQFLWLQSELERATERDELTLVFGHHAAGSMFYNLPDEGGGVPSCTTNDRHRHDVNPGCDRDPRPSTPLHFGDDFVRLLHEHPNVIAYVAGHSHKNRIRAFRHERGGFWEIRSPATADWPPQHRLVEVMDNRDGTLSIFATVLDHTAPATAPASGTAADDLDLGALASIGRTLSYNDPQEGPAVGRAGRPTDQNVELLVADPRDETSTRESACLGRASTRAGTSRPDRIRGTRRNDVIAGHGGRDTIAGSGGRDRLCGGRGGDHLRGGRGADRISGGPGTDRLRGGRGRDRLNARDGARDVVRCGPGRRDRARVDHDDRVRGCERTQRRR